MLAGKIWKVEIQFGEQKASCFLSLAVIEKSGAKFMSGGDKEGFGILIAFVCVVVICMVAGLLQSIAQKPWLLLIILAAIVVRILMKRDQQRVNKNSEESRRRK
jgi:Flp pilus assembly protein TadB